jgi:hypothetical protein
METFGVIPLLMRDPELESVLDATVRLAIYEEFVKSGRPPEVGELASKLQQPVAEIQASLRRLADTHVLVVEDDLRIRMAMPFSAVPTSFRVTSKRSAWFANCAWDALGIPAALDVDARIETSCPDCGNAIVIEVRSGKLVMTLA